MKRNSKHFEAFNDEILNIINFIPIEIKSAFFHPHS